MIDQIKYEMGGACSMHRAKERCIQGFGGKPEGKRPVGRCKRRWQEDNIKVDLQEMGWMWLRIGTGGGLL
jgi:hypothetical protein